LAAALEISLWAFAVGGFFLSLGYSEVLYTVLGLGVALATLADRAPATEREETTRQHPLEQFSRSVRADLSGRPMRAYSAGSAILASPARNFAVRREGLGVRRQGDKE
jgi:hypothetical protein